ncbi:signal recognition particle-docking protein FtsY, partial [Escherichia coli]
HPHVHQEPVIDEPYIEELVEQEIAEDDVIKPEPTIVEPEPESIDVIAEIARSEEVVDLDTDDVEEPNVEDTQADARPVVQHEQERPTK